MRKIYVNKNVYEAAMERVEFIFKEFDNVFISFSAGKDSAICFHLCYTYAKEHNCLDKLAIWMRDVECLDPETAAFAERIFNGYPEIKRKYWLCLTSNETTPISSFQHHYLAWDPKMKDFWVRPIPDSPYVCTDDHCPFPPTPHWWELIHNIESWFSKTYGSTASVIGLRGAESLRRQRIFLNNNRKNMYKNQIWTCPYLDDVVNCYIIYDWDVDDIWTANAKFGWDYNKTYDKFFWAGYPANKMRLSTPFFEFGQSQIEKYKEIAPEFWDKLLKRVQGVNFANIYDNTEAFNAAPVLPEKFKNWYDYKIYLLSTLPPGFFNLDGGEKEMERLKPYLNSHDEDISQMICSCIMRNDHRMIFFDPKKLQRKNNNEKIKNKINSFMIQKKGG